MIFIKKNTEPLELRLLRNDAIEKNLSPEVSYNKLKGETKEIVRQSLLQEQGHLCAYCMCEIPRTDVDKGISPIRIEHIYARNPNSETDIGQGLDYLNLVAVCNGNTARKTQHKHINDLTCDAHKGNVDLIKVNPLNPETLESIFYNVSNGEIGAEDADVNYDLTETLNLNCNSSPIVKERLIALEELMSYMDSLDTNQLVDYCKNNLLAYQNETDKKTPYQGILIWYLKSMLFALNES